MRYAKVALIGRPNVGKSSLFNRLLGRRKALVDDQPGLTRDRHYADLDLNAGRLALIDTAGLEEGSKASLAQRLNQISREAIAEADAVIFVVDGAVGLTPADQDLARMLKKSGKPVMLVSNKSDTKRSADHQADLLRLGFGPAIQLSAEHGIGLPDLVEALSAYATLPPPENESQETPTADPDTPPPGLPSPLRLTIVGRPNAGKSTLVNALLGQERMLTGPEAGLTRDSIATQWTVGGQLYELVDTAGLRRKAKIVDDVERMSATASIHSIDHADAVILVLDATQSFEHQDRTIAAKLADMGKPLVVALNKWDLVEDKDKTAKTIRDELNRGLSQVKDVPMVPISALTGQGVRRLLGPVENLVLLAQTRLGTGALNRFLEKMVDAHNPPVTPSGRRLKLKYITQVAVNPPTFAVFCNQPADMPDSYLRYLSNGLREEFELRGIVLRLFARGGGDNPYAPKGKNRGDD